MVGAREHGLLGAVVTIRCRKVDQVKDAALVPDDLTTLSHQGQECRLLLQSLETLQHRVGLRHHGHGGKMRGPIAGQRKVGVGEVHCSQVHWGMGLPGGSSRGSWLKLRLWRGRTLSRVP